LNANLKPNFEKAYVRANDTLVTSSAIATFPFSSKALVEEYNEIRCRSYKRAREHGVDISNFGSDSSVIFRKENRVVIFYNETKPQPHVKFSILHEFAHYILNHNFSYLENEAYNIAEVEANYFAAQVLMPEQLLREFESRGVKINCEFLQKAFGVSAQAASKRIKTLERTSIKRHSISERESDELILLKFSNFLNSTYPSHIDDVNFEGYI
jgi:hypothetical protein